MILGTAGVPRIWTVKSATHCALIARERSLVSESLRDSRYPLRDSLPSQRQPGMLLLNTRG